MPLPLSNPFAIFFEIQSLNNCMRYIKNKNLRKYHREPFINEKPDFLLHIHIHVHL